MSSDFSVPSSLPAKPALRRNYLAFPEVIAQAVGGTAPSAVPAINVSIIFAVAGNGTWATFAFAAIAMLFLVAQMNVFSRRGATSGGLYVYAAKGLGPLMGVVAGWSFLIAYLFGEAFVFLCMIHISSALIHQMTGMSNSFMSGAALGVLGLALSWGIAYRDIKLSTRVTLAIEFATMSAILFLIGFYFVHKGAVIDSAQLRLEGVGASRFRLGLVFAFLSFVGFESASTLGAEAREPLKTIPRALVSCILIFSFFFCISGYGLVDAFHAAMPGLDKIDSPFMALAQSLGIGAFGTLVTVGVLTSFFACSMAIINAGSRVLYVFAHHGLIHSGGGKVHKDNATPHIAITLFAALAFLLAFGLVASGVSVTDAMDYLGTVSSFGFLSCYILVAVGAPLYLKRRGELRAGHVASAVIAVAMLAIPLFGSLYPVPEWPLNILPYVFLTLIALCVAHLFYMKRANPGLLSAIEEELLGDSAEED
ncbi:MAG: APC family permease [Alphaproteobacteria bacterium]|nr:APC family permease [Alphaproteobacteria bacterium]